MVAPQYHISYKSIKGNIFTGVSIKGVAFEKKELSQNLTLRWNPSKLLYKTIAINQLKIEKLNTEVLKALIASFASTSTKEDNSTAQPFGFVVDVNHFVLSLEAFEEQGIAIAKSYIEANNTRYTDSSIDVGRFSCDIESNLTTLSLQTSLHKGKLEIGLLKLTDIDTIGLEKMLGSDDNSSTKKEPLSQSSISSEPIEQEPIPPFIPTQVLLKDVQFNLKPRVYKDATIERCEVTFNDAFVDIVKLLNERPYPLDIESYSLKVRSNMAKIDILGNLKKDTIGLSTMNLSKIDTLGLQGLLPKKHTKDENQTKQAEPKESLKSNPSNDTALHPFMPKYLKIKRFHTDVLPVTYAPVHLLDSDLNITDITINLATRVVEEGDIHLMGQTNLSNFSHQSTIKTNHLVGQTHVTPNQRLFELYKLPLRKEAIEDIVIDLNASEENIAIVVNSSAKHILLTQPLDNNSSETNNTEPFNVDIERLVSHINYDINSSHLRVNSHILLSTPYAKDIRMNTLLTMDENISYEGNISIDKVIGVDENYTKALNHLSIEYRGNLDGVETDILSDGLKGSFISKDLKNGHFHLETTQSIGLGKMVALPLELNATAVDVVIDVPLNLLNPIPIEAKAKIYSNVTNIDATILYDKNVTIKTTTTIPKYSLLKQFNKQLKWDRLSPIRSTIYLDQNSSLIQIKSKPLIADISYGLSSKKIDATLNTLGVKTTIKGQTQGQTIVRTNITSMKRLLQNINSIYPIKELPKVEGEAELYVDIQKLQHANIILSSPQIKYSQGRSQKVTVIDYVMVMLDANASQVKLSSYSINYDEMQLFASKPSIIKMQEGLIDINQLWLNDALKVSGRYDTQNQKGEILADAKALAISHKMIDLKSDMNIKTLLNKEKTNIQGKVILLGGEIHYDLSTKTFPSDSDIMIVQQMQAQQSSPFMENLTMFVQVQSQEPLLYKEGPIDIEAFADMGIHKSEKEPLMVVGELRLAKGGSYIFENKKFLLNESYIYFTGNPNTPLLDISVEYQTLDYLITIAVTGTPSAPNINFSSVPPLKKEQILSIILFDSQEGAGTNSGTDMMKMMGGAVAKSALSNFGIELDHLAIGANGSVEVGKNITKKITFVYLKDTIPQVKVKYRHSRTLESVISADEESQAYDIVYKKDFSDEDILFSK